MCGGWLFTPLGHALSSHSIRRSVNRLPGAVGSDIGGWPHGPSYVPHRHYVVFLLCSACETPGRADIDRSSPRRKGRPNISVIVVDDLCWDELGAAGHPFLETPHIDALARDEARFAN